LNDWSLSIRDKRATDVIYIDYAKAFDTVCHAKLLHKLSAVGIDGQLLAWIGNFLSGRTQVTRVGYSYSESASLTSGVIQGSCLGPLLFLVYINDVVELFGQGTVCKLFADDIKLYCVIESSDDSDCLQSNLNKLSSWSKDWQLNISSTKSVYMRIGDRSGLPEAKYNISEAPLQRHYECKDLGVVVDDNLKLSKHIDSIVAKARQRASLIYKCFVSRSPDLLARAFTTYVRPILEYACVVWNLVYVGLIDKIESVQRQFTKRIPKISHLNYRDRLIFLNLDSLEV
jgi:hypothetical protein